MGQGLREEIPGEWLLANEPRIISIFQQCFSKVCVCGGDIDIGV